MTVSEAVERIELAAPPQVHLTVLARQFVTGVAVVTTQHADGVHGVTVSTLSLLSHRPPLVSMVLRTASPSVRAFERSGGFAVSVLADGQSWLARHFADARRPPGMGPLGEECWLPGRNGPVLVGAICWLECRLEQVIPTGDHELIVGRVQEGRLHPGRPLVNFAGELHDDAFAFTTRGGQHDG